MLKLIYESYKDSDFYFATNVQASDPVFYLEINGRKLLFLDSREYVVGKEHANKDVEVVLFDDYLTKTPNNTHGLELNITQKQLLCLFEAFAQDETEIHVPSNFSLPLADFLRSVGYTIIIDDPFFRARLYKDDLAITKIQDAVKRLEKAFYFIQEILKASNIKGDKIYYKDKILTSEFLKREVTIFLLREDMELTDGIIIASGYHASIPHHSGSGPILPHQTIIVDIFPRCSRTGYFADITRTYFKGEPGDEIKKLYETVRAVQEAQTKMVKPAVPAMEIHTAGCGMFVDAGYQIGKEGFAHGTGHGLGLDLHESPRLNNRSKEILEVGNVVTVEPGLYYEKLGGVRIEDDIVITPDGYQNLVSLDKRMLVF